MVAEACWEVLQLAATPDTKAIKKAYARLLVKYNPEIDATGYQRLREALDQALEEARWLSQTENEPTPDFEIVDTTAQNLDAPPELLLEHTEEDSPEAAPNLPPTVEQAVTQIFALLTHQGLEAACANFRYWACHPALQSIDSHHEFETRLLQSFYYGDSPCRPLLLEIAEHFLWSLNDNPFRNHPHLGYAYQATMLILEQAKFERALLQAYPGITRESWEQAAPALFSAFSPEILSRIAESGTHRQVVTLALHFFSEYRYHPEFCPVTPENKLWWQENVLALQTPAAVAPKPRRRFFASIGIWLIVFFVALHIIRACGEPRRPTSPPQSNPRETRDLLSVPSPPGTLRANPFPTPPSKP